MRGLLREQLVEDRDDPVLKSAVIVVRYNEVADAIQPARAQLRAVERKVGEVRAPEALDKVLLDAARGRHDRADVLVLHEEAQHVAQAGRDEVRSVAEHDRAARRGARVCGCGVIRCRRLVREPPCQLHLIHASQTTARLGDAGAFAIGGVYMRVASARLRVGHMNCARTQNLTWVKASK